MGFLAARADAMFQHGRLSSVKHKCRCYPVIIVSGTEVCHRPWWRSAVALAAVVTAVGVWVLVLGHAEVRHEPAASHRAHVLVSSLGGEFTVNSNHAHIENPSVAHHEAFMSAVLPNAPVTTVAALSVVVAAVGAVGLFGRHLILGGRGPPRGLAAVLTGQELLTRLCSSRR